MNKPFSIYLDLVRFGAACLVYLYHSNMRLLVKTPLPGSNYGHSSVIVFFVLSGFVIAYVAGTKENNWLDYTASRLSRVYSVVLPAIALTLVLDFAGRRLYPALYDYPFDHLAVRLGASLAMLNEIWFVSITSLSNVPYWSITFEFWYYVLFGLVYFVPGRAGLFLAAVCCLFIGPKIVLLFPVWLAGVALYRWAWLARISFGFGAALVLLSLVGIPMFETLGVFDSLSQWTSSLLGEAWFREFTFARFVLGDYLLCALVLMNFAGMRRIAERFAPLLLAIERPVRTVAAYTFTLYLLHQPLFLFWGAVVRGDPNGLGYWLVVTALTALSVAAVGYFTENKRQLLKAALQRTLRRVAKRGAALGTAA